MQQILFEPSVTQSYFKEYLDKVKYYDNVQRKSIFIRYLNINRTASNYNIETKGTFDHFSSGVAYDIYDHTPAYSFGAITNTSTDKTDMGGLVFDGLGDLVVYTIREPALGDLITFAYGPSEDTLEIFRVIQIDTSVYGKGYDINFHRLTLEYAPIKDISKLNIVNTYVYLMTQEKNISQAEYISILNNMELNIQYLDILVDYFDEKLELYYYTINDRKIAPLNINRYLYKFLCYEYKLDRYFDKYKKPFGIRNYLQAEASLGLDLQSRELILLRTDNLPAEYTEIINSNLDLISYTMTYANR